MFIRGEILAMILIKSRKERRRRNKNVRNDDFRCYAARAEITFGTKQENMIFLVESFNHLIFKVPIVNYCSMSKERTNFSRSFACFSEVFSHHFNGEFFYIKIEFLAEETHSDLFSFLREKRKHWWSSSESGRKF